MDAEYQTQTFLRRFIKHIPTPLILIARNRRYDGKATIFGETLTVFPMLEGRRFGRGQVGEGALYGIYLIIIFVFGLLCRTQEYLT